MILDVVYNHTAEGNHLGPTLSMRGIDNEAYYRLVEDDPQYYMDYTGTGNSLNVRNPHTLQLIMDSLRYWVTEMHVDGFRFDLASALAREFYDVDRLSTFFDLVQQDPIVSQVKLIAEPWDVGPGGYQVGNFPPRWTEWNGEVPRHRPRLLARRARRRWASSPRGSPARRDLYQDDGRRPYASINFVTAHDGFTLADLVSYNEKHNEANGEGGHDGADDNRSWNCGVEGPTDDAEIIELRERQRRNFLATLFLSQGVPMMLHGDELGRTQHGNNNGYCQDSEISWMDWSNWRRTNADLMQFTAGLTALRRGTRCSAAAGSSRAARSARARELGDIAWFTPSGEEMTEQNWDDGFGKAVVVFLNGEAIPDLDQRGERVVDDSFLLAFNAHYEDIDVTLPGNGYGQSWAVVVDTATGDGGPPPTPSRSKAAASSSSPPARWSCCSARTPE